MKEITPKKERHWLMRLVVIFIAWRAALWLVAYLAQKFTDFGQASHFRDAAESMANLWARWDAGWYWSVAEQGYHMAEGQATILARKIHLINSLDSKRVMLPTEAPSVFLIPISFVLTSAVKAARPIIPRQATSMEREEKIMKRFCSCFSLS